MQSPARGLKFGGARPQVACVILAPAASRVTFRGYYESTSTKQYSIYKVFQKLRIHLSADSYL